MRADHLSTMLGAKHLVVTLNSGTTYHYIVSTESVPVFALGQTEVVIQHDTFSKADIKSIRLKNITRFLLDEDSTSFGNNYAVDNGMLAFRRTLTVGCWGSIVLPVSLTGAQVRYAFGDDAMLATVRGFREDDNATVDYETIALDTDEVVLKSGEHYLIRPSREPDVAANKTVFLATGLRATGPLYLIPEVSLALKQSPGIKGVKSADGTTNLIQRGTYTVKDGSSTTNQLLTSKNPVYTLGDDGLFSVHTDPVLVKAFSSWFYDMSSEPHTISFYVDGVSINPTGIGAVANSHDALQADNRIYDLRGRVVGRDGDGQQLPKGIYVKNGKKFIIR